jgi:hypothetical protein
MNATAVGPNLEPISLPLKQQAPGRYVGEFTPEEAGSYMLSVLPGAGKLALTTGVTVPFSDEYRIRQANMRLIEQIASNEPTGGTAGQVLPELAPENLNDLLGVDTFRGGIPPAKSLKDIWPLVVLSGATLFFADVFVRRVSLDLGLPLRKLAAWMSKRKWSAEDQSRQATLERLRTSKSKVSDEIGRQRSNTSLQESREPIDSPAISSEVSAASSFGRQIESSSKPTAARPSDENSKNSKSAPADSENYTSRLLEAKRKAQKKNP